MGEVLHALRDEYTQLADAYEHAESIGWPIIDLGKRLLAARNELQAALAELTEPAPVCHECGQPIDGWAHPDGKSNYHCDKCCPTCDHIENARWCACTDHVGPGPCPVCGGELFPF